MKIETFGLSDLGKHRENNEDNFYIDRGINILIVADGMGGAASGQVASKLAVDIIKEQMHLGLKNGKITNSSAAGYLVSCIKIANQNINEAGREYAQNKGMGTTVVAGFIYGNHLYVANVGDSRLYLIRKNDITQLSEDHSIVMEQVRKGLITMEEASKSSMQNILTRALGTDKTVEVYSSRLPLADNDYILLCSDGLMRMVSDKEILSTVTELKKPDLICQKLIAMANDAGGKDNVTVAVALVQKEIFNWKNKIKKLFTGQG